MLLHDGSELGDGIHRTLGGMERCGKRGDRTEPLHGRIQQAGGATTPVGAAEGGGDAVASHPERRPIVSEQKAVPVDPFGQAAHTVHREAGNSGSHHHHNAVPTRQCAGVSNHGIPGEPHLGGPGRDAKLPGELLDIGLSGREGGEAENNPGELI